MTARCLPRRAELVASLSLILAGRLLIRPVVVPIAVHSGLRALVIAGTCLTALQYPLLAAVHGVGAGLFARAPDRVDATVGLSGKILLFRRVRPIPSTGLIMVR